MASQRNRITRGPNRNSGGGLGAGGHGHGHQAQGEEYGLWQQTKEALHTLAKDQNTENALVQQIIAQDAHMAAQTNTMDAEAEERKQEELFRKGVRQSEALSESLKKLVQDLEVIRAVQKRNEEEAAAAVAAGRGGLIGLGGLGGGGTPVRGSGLLGTGGSTRSAGRATTREREREREKERGRERERERREREQREASERASAEDGAKDPYEFEGPGDEMDVEAPPVAAAAAVRKGGGHRGSSVAASGERTGSRDSMPPKTKAESVEPPGSLSGSNNTNAASSSATAAARSKVMFVKGQDVVFKPKQAAPGEPSEWFLGKVQQVLGEGKSRRYKVKDEDPDVPPEQRQEYRTSASSMIPLPARGNKDLAELERGRWVLALYPDSTTFYKAEVMSTDVEKGKVNLRFEGEENSGTLQEVERWNVVEYRS